MSQEIMQISTQDGTITPFSFEVNLSKEDREKLNKRLEMAVKGEGKRRDVTAMYWEARKGDKKTLAFTGFKVVQKTDEDGTVKPALVAKFNDGNREIVMAQVVIIDSMKNAEFGDIFDIECIEATPKKAKKFTIEKVEFE
jgi:hypothetical protein